MEENKLQKLFYEHYLEKIIQIFESFSNEEYIESGQSVALDLLIYCAKQQL